MTALEKDIYNVLDYHNIYLKDFRKDINNRLNNIFAQQSAYLERRKMDFLKEIRNCTTADSFHKQTALFKKNVLSFLRNMKRISSALSDIYVTTTEITEKYKKFYYLKKGTDNITFLVDGYKIKDYIQKKFVDLSKQITDYNRLIQNITSRSGLPLIFEEIARDTEYNNLFTKFVQELNINELNTIERDIGDDNVVLNFTNPQIQNVMERLKMYITPECNSTNPLHQLRYNEQRDFVNHATLPEYDSTKLNTVSLELKYYIKLNIIVQQNVIQDAILSTEMMLKDNYYKILHKIGSTPDGNCFYNTVSRILYENENNRDKIKKTLFNFVYTFFSQTNKRKGEFYKEFCLVIGQMGKNDSNFRDYYTRIEESFKSENKGLNSRDIDLYYQLWLLNPTAKHWASEGIILLTQFVFRVGLQMIEQLDDNNFLIHRSQWTDVTQIAYIWYKTNLHFDYIEGCCISNLFLHYPIISVDKKNYIYKNYNITGAIDNQFTSKYNDDEALLEETKKLKENVENVTITDVSTDEKIKKIEKYVLENKLI